MVDLLSEVLRLPDAARELGMGPKAVRELMRRGEIGHYSTPGGHVRIPRWALREYQERQIAASMNGSSLNGKL